MLVKGITNPFRIPSTDNGRVEIKKKNVTAVIGHVKDSMRDAEVDVPWSWWKGKTPGGNYIPGRIFSSEEKLHKLRIPLPHPLHRRLCA